MRSRLILYVTTVIRSAKRVPLLIASGGDNPVVDERIDGKNSVFGRAFLHILESNQSISVAAKKKLHCT
jgi:hypothetical protein